MGAVVESAGKTDKPTQKGHSLAFNKRFTQGFALVAEQPGDGEGGGGLAGGWVEDGVSMQLR